MGRESLGNTRKAAQTFAITGNSRGTLDPHCRNEKPTELAGFQESGYGESNPGIQLGKLMFYH